MKTVEKIMAEDSRESLQKRIAELEVDNSHLKTAVAESADTLQEDYNLLQEGNKSLLAE
jgi:septal ring factor EnvC (AmiA/AmiB activator)